MDYTKLFTIENVAGFCPNKGIYAYSKGEKSYLFLDDILIEKDCARVPCELIHWNQYIYAWYGSGKFELYEGHRLLKSIESNTHLLNEQTQYIGKHFIDLDSCQTYSNFVSPIDEQLILSEFIPYRLYVEDDIIIAYDNFRGEFKRINTEIETLWQFTIASLGDSPYLDEEDKIGDFLGITNNYLWIITNLGRLIAIDIETGEVQRVASSHPIDEKYNYHINKAFGHIYIKEENGNLYCMSYNMVTIIDTQTFSIKEEYNFREEDPEGMGQYESVYKPLLQGDYFTFLGEKEEDFGSGIRRVGIFDYKTRKLVWEYEVISEDEFDETRNHLVVPQPLYMSGNKLYIKDFKNTLHIFERKDI
ncbi:hypothetical protein IX307_002903 [Bacteroides pyogenes]|uniref:PQQ-binding-like beta-propeller repeat protein n=2 Tax=Bacteroides pyogenes TaxID=310300 RepID=UPI0011E3D324|nr:PQQ-binding-like beta-propeller repeat protein [Bacteroides pyogenes]MBR8726407.1 hypothetical protein [Bacteroides pyogenes]MBR8739840.1 hypothetical protein [Bacteroides pyogenes]MBR8788544.1 hypothetical protein [Bacteroides pyogenes]MBR8796885.1 hypothetical protein [Bacteroides pyogenes]MBR8810491.1 hypothetical protein [Bacteroides pyogenes]